jgi:fermentation-respiration switch protein FrsA (DUF1100 family)
MAAQREGAGGPGDKPSRGWGRSIGWVAWRIARPFLIAIACVTIFVVVYLMFNENSLIFYPSLYPDGDWQPRALTFTDAWFESADGQKLHGWYVAHEKPLAVVLFCHGNGGNVTDRADKLRQMNRVAQASILVFDYRGYGRSGGFPSESGVLADARQARAWLAKQAGIAEEKVVVMGESLGGAVAVDLAAADGARGLILENTFTSIPEVASAHYPWFPASLFLRTRFDSLHKIPAYHGPLLQSHGDRDSIVPYRIGRRLFDAANEPKRFLSLAGADHNDLHSRAYYKEVRTFLENLPQ